MKTSLRFLIVLLVTISIEKGLEILLKPENKLSPTEKLQELLRTKRELAPINMHDQECEEEGLIEEGDNLKSYFLCEKSGEDPGLLYKEHKCEKNDFFNASIGDCSKLPGGGHIDCITHNSCPEEFTGITQFPNSTMLRNYVICLERLVIVAECEELWYFSNETQNCQPEPFKRKTVLIESNCEKIEQIQCETADVIEVDIDNENISETCSNCYYFCVEAENNTFALTIYCFGNVTTEEEISTEISTLFTHIEETTKSSSKITSENTQTTSEDQVTNVNIESTTKDTHPEIILKFEPTISPTDKSIELPETSTKREISEESTTKSIRTTLEDSAEIEIITTAFTPKDSKDVSVKSTILPTIHESSIPKISLTRNTEPTGKELDITTTELGKEISVTSSIIILPIYPEVTTEQHLVEQSTNESKNTSRKKIISSEESTELAQTSTKDTTLPVEETSFSTPENLESTTQKSANSTEKTFETTATELDKEISVTSSIIIIPPINPKITTEQLVENPTSEPAAEIAKNVKFTSAKPPAETTTTSPELSTITTTINNSFSETTQSIFPITSTTKERSTSVSIFHTDETEKEIIEQTTISTISPARTTPAETGNFTTVKPASSESPPPTQTTTPHKFQQETFPSANNITEATTIKSITSSPAETTPEIAVIPQITSKTSSSKRGEFPVTTEKLKAGRHQHCIDKGPPCTSPGYFRLNHSCTQHYECYFSKLCNKLVSSRIYNCPKCLKFNEAKMCCDLPENVPECSNLYQETPHSFAPPKSKKKSTCTGPGTFFAPDDCEKYYSCSKNKSSKFINLVVNKCPKGSRFNRKLMKCEKGLQCRRSLPKCKNGVDYYISDKFDCSKFYHCLGKMFVPLTCPAGSIFDGKKCDKKSTTYLCDWEALKKKLHKHKKL